MPSRVTRVIAMLITCVATVCMVFLFGLGHALNLTGDPIWYWFGLFLEAFAVLGFLVIAFGISRATDQL